MSNKKIILIDEEDSISWTDLADASDHNSTSPSPSSFDREFYMKKIIEAIRESHLDYVDCLIQIQKMKNDLIKSKMAYIKKN